VHPARRISVLPELLRDLKTPYGSVVAVSCLAGILIDSGNCEPQATRMTEVYDVLKEFSTLLINFCEEVGPGVTVRIAPPLYRSKPTWLALGYVEFREVKGHLKFFLGVINYVISIKIFPLKFEAFLNFIK
jgi:hypothetical protein